MVVVAIVVKIIMVMKTDNLNERYFTNAHNGKKTIQITKEETRFWHLTGYSFRLAATDLTYAPSHIQDSTHHGLCYTSCGTLAGTKKHKKPSLGSTMKDGSSGPSHNEWNLYHVWLPGLIEGNEKCFLYRS